MFEGYKKDKHFAPILEILQNSTPKPKQLAQVKNYELKDKQIYLKKGQRLVIPRIKEIITKVLEENHDNEIAGHVGTEKTYEIISRSYFWPGMNKDIKKYIQTCESCQRNKSRNQQPTGLLQPLQIPTKKWEHVTMDFIVQLPTTKQGFDSIVVFVDKLSKRAHFCPTYTTATAPEIAKIFFIIIFRYHGLPKAIISDRDAKFTSNFWQTLFKQVGTKLSMSTAFHPQTDGQTERLNRILEEMLRAYVNYQQDNWDEHLPAAEFAYNNSKQGSTNFTPFELDCGQTPETPPTLAANQTTNVASTNEFLKQ